MEVVFRNCVKEARRRGQTIFLSSHILSEVEALCDRVGILREGGGVGVSLLLRVVADTSSGASWLTPLGWAEELRPFT